MIWPRSQISCIVTLASLGTAIPAIAQEETRELDSKELKRAATGGVSAAVPDGWRVGIKFGGTVNFASNNLNAASAGGGEEGATFQLGIVIGANADYQNGPHRWKNQLSIQETQTKQPERAFRKSLDALELLSTYLYSFGNPSWLGPFARFRLNTQLLRGSYFNDEAAEGWLSQSIGPDGTVIGGNPNTDLLPFDDVGDEQRVVQTEPFEPLLLRESVGFFANPYTEEGFTLDAKLGVGAQQIIARDGVAFVELINDGDNVIPVFREIEPSNDVGAEGEIAMTGILIKDRVNWRLTANVFLPFIASGEVINEAQTYSEKPTGLDYAVVDIGGGLSLKLAEWASLDYVVTLRRVPLVVRGLQVQQGIILSAGFDVL